MSLTEEIRRAATIGDVMRMLFKRKTVAEVREFMDAYRQVTPHADGNVSHMLGYCSEEVRTCYGKLLRGKQPNPVEWLTRKQLEEQVLLNG